jgi:hypothetical protein
MLKLPLDRKIVHPERFVISRNLCRACNHKEKCVLGFFNVRLSDLFIFQAV